LKIIKPSDTRWLAHERGVKAVKASYSVPLSQLWTIFTTQVIITQVIMTQVMITQVIMTQVMMTQVMSQKDWVKYTPK